LKRLLDTWDRNGSISGPPPWQMIMMRMILGIVSWTKKTIYKIHGTYIEIIHKN
jgi:hypothetical protein